MSKGGIVTYAGPLNAFLESERIEGGVILKGTVEFTNADGPNQFDGKFRLEMFGGIVLYDSEDNPIGTVLPSQVDKATGERWGYPKGNCVTWFPQQHNLVFVQ